MECGDTLMKLDGGILEYSSCEHVYNAQYCIKRTGWEMWSSWIFWLKIMHRATQESPVFFLINSYLEHNVNINHSKISMYTSVADIFTIVH